MNKHSVFKAFAGLGAGLLLLGAAAAPQAAITITKADGSICTDGTINVNGTVTPVDATCSAPPPPGNFTLTVSKAGTGSGTVTGTGFSCGADCTESYPEGTAVNVTLTATANPGSTFSGWSGQGCSGTGPCTVNTTITGNLSVTATFTADAPPPGACGALPANTTVVDTGNMNAVWAQQTFFPLPQIITAFEMTVPSGFNQENDVTVTKTSGAQRSKLVVVSTCPGVLEPVGGQSSCMKYQLESIKIKMSASPSASSYYCKLEANKTYYINAVSKTALTDTAYSCTNTTNCSFFASRSAPY
ncbi:hypothetical protein [Immundisolibacter sp.]|uniref:InlB B-repeat-containing protein n=1 Tax=Immundisolibacter sp. TaxID=1934948 RepID=UPI002620B8A6|nr:hypothetical protein [Immundisolibacter sp.]MDD3652468.1 hypothetical protein [Immundisolibacter sp.]